MTKTTRRNFLPTTVATRTAAFAGNWLVPGRTFGASAPIVLGAPNVVRGGSHKGNASALDLIAMGLCDALASDYHYPSMRRAAFLLADGGLMDFGAAWGMISSGPAQLLGLTDRGTLTLGQRADLVLLDAKTRDICATLSGGQVTYMKGDVARRFFG